MKTVSLLSSVALSLATCALCWWLGEFRALPELRALAAPIGLLVGSIPVVVWKMRGRAHAEHRAPVRSERVLERAFAGSAVSAAILFAVALWCAWPAWVLGPGVLLAMLANYWVAALSTRGETVPLASQQT